MSNENIVVIADSSNIDEKWYRMPGKIENLTNDQQSEYENWLRSKNYCSLDKNDEKTLALACHLNQDQFQIIVDFDDLKEILELSAELEESMNFAEDCRKWLENNEYDVRLKSLDEILTDNIYLDRDNKILATIEQFESEIDDLDEYFEFDTLDLYEQHIKFDTFEIILDQFANVIEIKNSDEDHPFFSYMLQMK